MSKKKKRKRQRDVEEDFDERPITNKKAAENPYDDLADEPLNSLIRRLKILHWDFLLVGDGSGSGWNIGAGWGSVSIERLTGERKVWTGAVNSGTVNLGEIMAYLVPLEWLASREVERRRKSEIGVRAYQVHIVTDSEYCKNTGNSVGRMMNKNAGLWSCFDVFARHGFVLNWHWVPRLSVGLNQFCDNLAGLARRTLRDYNPIDRLVSENIETRSVNEINPTG